MKLSFTTLVLAAAFAVSGAVSDSDADSSQPQQHLRRANVFNDNNNGNVDVIVVLKDEGRRRRLVGNGQATVAERKAAAEDNKAAASDAATSMGAVAKLTYGSAIYGFATNVPPGLLKKIKDDPRVDYVEDDATIQLDPTEMADEERRQLAPPPGKGPNKGDGGGGGGDGPAQTIPWGITRVNGIESYSGSAKAYVLDSGVDLDHPDLNVDIANSRGFWGKSNSPDDQNGHGTHVAGTIAAINNSIGVIGVAPGASVVSVRVLDRRGSGSYSGVIAGIDYVGGICESGDVANMSLGGPYSQAVNDAVIAASANCRFVLAAGNESTNAGSKSPASAEGENIYTVSAFSNGDNWASFSNYGSVVDYAGPGVSINSTWKDGGYRSISGTSMAAPHIAGVLLTGDINVDGTVNGDPDGVADPIGVCSAL